MVLLVDGLHTRELLDAAAEMGALRQSSLLLAYVRPHGAHAGMEMLRRRPGSPRPPAAREARIHEAEHERGVEALHEAATLAAPLAGSVDTVELDGEPGPAVCQLAVQCAADLLIVRAGGRDQPGPAMRSLGPTARFIADHSPCPVLLVRRR